jgi:pantoate--beta-alanine ligase
MALDLNLPLEIIGRPIMREPDGLALSSRNVYLSPEERRRAVCLIQALTAAQKQAAAGERDATVLLAAARNILETTPGVSLEYLELVDPHTLQPVTRLQGPARLAAAIRLGSTRLIDNVLIEENAVCSA